MLGESKSEFAYHFIVTVSVIAGVGTRFTFEEAPYQYLGSIIVLLTIIHFTAEYVGRKLRSRREGVQ